MGFSRPALHLVPVTVPLFRYLVCDAHHIRKGGGRRALRACPCPRLFNSNPRRGSECDAATRSYPLRSMRKALRASVTFEPGARTAWHMHPLGQTLIVTAGCGWVQLSALNGVRTFATTEVGA